MSSMGELPCRSEVQRSEDLSQTQRLGIGSLNLLGRALGRIALPTPWGTKQVLKVVS